MNRTVLRSLLLAATVAGALPLALCWQDSVAAQSGGTSDPVLVGAGDIAPDCLNGASLAGAEGTAALLDGIAGTVFAVGDLAYPDGTLTSFNSCYDPTWGRHKARTYPATGNHEYHTANAAGYFDYWNGIGNQTGPAGDRSNGYYSYNLGTWHVVVLNSECGSQGLWDVNGCLVGSPQERWLRADLAASPTNNIIAVFHKPRYSSASSESAVQPLWQALYDYGADLVLNGHVHSYERLAPAGPTGLRDSAYGIRQFVVGTGGVPIIASSTPIALSEVQDSTSHGVLKLTLHAASYDWQFIPAAGDTFADSGSAPVHGMPPTTTVANWMMDENGGTTLVDSSSFANNATIVGSPSWIAGHAGLALSLNGSTDYAVAPDNPSLRPAYLTLAIWVNPSRIATQYVLKKAGSYELSLSNQGLPFFRLNGDNTYRLNATTPQTNGTWMHVAGTYDGSVMHLYVNGVEQGQGLAGPSAIAVSTQGVGLGAQGDGTSMLQGAIDDARIYSRPLSAAEIQALATNSPPAVNAGPDQSVTLPSTATLAGSATDDGLPNPPGTLATAWSIVSGPGSVSFANAASPSTTASFTTAGTYVLQLAASDGMYTSKDSATITVSGSSTPTNQAPVVNAGPDQTVALSAGATLTGTVSDDGLPNPPGTLTVAWTKVSGPGTVAFANAAAPSTTASFSTPGLYVLQLSASDSALTTTDTVAVTVTGLVGDWAMDEGSGTQLLDSSTAQNVASITGSPTWVTGQYGLALQLNGTTDYATAPNSATLNLTGPLTVAAWVRRTGVATQNLVKKALGSTTGTPGYELSLSTTGKAFVRLNSSDTYRVNSLTPYPTTGAWMHLAATYDGTTITLYVNGVLEGSVPGPASVATNTLALGIGAQPDGGNKFKGALDEVRLYNRALAASEIHTLAQAAANQAPVANGAQVTTPEDTPVAITLSATDADGDVLTYKISTPPQHGTISGTPPAISYSPSTNYNGSDSFTFTASDANSTSNTATVNITITAVNDAPVASNGSMTSVGGAAVSGQLVATDVDGDVLTYALVGAPKKGTVTITASTGQFKYVPGRAGKGSDSFTWRANDGKLNSNTATMSITLK